MYLKKTKMYNLLVYLCKVSNIPFVPICKCVDYKFYRGSEWVKFYFDDYYVKLYHSKSFGGYFRFTMFDIVVNSECKNLWFDSIEEVMAYEK